MKSSFLPTRPMPWGKVIVTGLAAGTLDIILAFLNANTKREVPFERILQYIASGVFGKSAFTGGTTMAVWGLLFHYFIAMTFTIIIFFLYRQHIYPLKNRILTAIISGALVWAAMHFIVVPLSSVPPAKSHDPIGMIKAAVILMIAIGLPAVMVAHRHFSRPKGDRVTVPN